MMQDILSDMIIMSITVPKLQGKCFRISTILSDQIERICALIMSTKLPPKPTNLLENIMCDSDLDYLGKKRFHPGFKHAL